MTHRGIVVADLHLHNYRRFARFGEDGRSDRLDFGIDALRAAIAHAETRQATLYVLGDLIHARLGKVDALVMNSLRDALRESACPIVMLAGNHDRVRQSPGWGESSLRVLDDTGVTIVDEPATCINCDKVNLIPYADEPELLREALGKAQGSVILGHFGLVEEGGSYGNPSVGVVACSDIPPTANLALCGHFHDPSPYYGNVAVVGSPVELAFGAAHDDERGFIYFALDDKGQVVKLQRLPYHNAPNFYSVTPKTIGQYDLDGHYVRLILDDPAQADRLRIKLLGMNTAGVEMVLKPQRKAVARQTGISLELDPARNLDTYIQNNAPQGVTVAEVRKAFAKLLGKGVA